MAKDIAVLTGDLIKSTSLEDGRLDVAMDVLEKASLDVADWLHAPTYFTRARGDGWQVRITQPDLALRTALYLRACLRRAGKDLATRMSVAVGQGQLTGDDLNAASGPAFVDSGRGLTELGRHQHLNIIGVTQGATAAFVLADALSQGWTQAQARSIAALLHPVPPSIVKVAKDLDVSRQTVQDALDTTEFWAITHALETLEAKKQAK